MLYQYGQLWRYNLKHLLNFSALFIRGRKRDINTIGLNTDYVVESFILSFKINTQKAWRALLWLAMGKTHGYKQWYPQPRMGLNIYIVNIIVVEHAFLIDNNLFRLNGIQPRWSWWNNNLSPRVLSVATSVITLQANGDSAGYCKRWRRLINHSSDKKFLNFYAYRLFLQIVYNSSF